MKEKGGCKIGLKAPEGSPLGGCKEGLKAKKGLSIQDRGKIALDIKKNFKK